MSQHNLYAALASHTHIQQRSRAKCTVGFSTQNHAEDGSKLAKDMH